MTGALKWSSQMVTPAPTRTLRRKPSKATPLSENVKAFRAAVGRALGKPEISQPDFADFVAVILDLLRHWEQGTKPPPLPVLATIAHAQGCTVADLLKPNPPLNAARLKTWCSLYKNEGSVPRWRDLGALDIGPAVARNLVRLREAKGWGPGDLAAAAGMSASNISRYEGAGGRRSRADRASRSPRTVNLLKLAEALGVDAMELLEGLEIFPALLHHVTPKTSDVVTIMRRGGKDDPRFDRATARALKDRGRSPRRTKRPR